MQINGKGFDQWSLYDLNVILNNEVYRESEYIDYKRNFAILECEKSRENKSKKQVEFRSDICSFANAEGGYLIYGVGECAGVPNEFIGVSISEKNCDKFELDRRNELSGILPVVPNIQFKFINLEENKYIVIIHIQKGIFKPFVHLNDGVYRFYIRRGNGKQQMNYAEIKNQFIQSDVLSEKIENFRIKRECYYHEIVNNEPHISIQVIPNTFSYSNTYMDIYDMHIKGKVDLSTIFKEIVYGWVIPNVDGICVLDNMYDNEIFLQINNNGIIELLFKIKPKEVDGLQRIHKSSLVSKVEKIIQCSKDFYTALEMHILTYVCISIIGCKGFCSNIESENDLITNVDRNEIYCIPLEIKDMMDDLLVEKGKKHCSILLYNALGIRRS